MKLHQLVHTLSYGDAISGEVLALRRSLRELGYESDIFAINAHPKYKAEVYDYRDLEKTFSGEIILHYSLGSPLNDLYRSLRSARRSLVYHNITPASYFEGVNSRIVRDIEDGLRDLVPLCRVSDCVISDSEFNKRELQVLGVESTLLELPVDPHRWLEEANTGIGSLLKGDSSLHLLHVGRVAPNKRLEDVLKVFYFLHHFVHKQSKLWLVGIDTDTELYSFSLKRLMYELDLSRAVTFTGGVSDGEVRAFYENSSAYLCMSEHEGFCLPVIEAMHFGLPVLAFAAGALPETVDSGGVLFSEKKHAEIAELIFLLYSDQKLRRQLVEAGRERVERLSYERFQKNVRALFQNSFSRAVVN